MSMISARGTFIHNIVQELSDKTEILLINTFCSEGDNRPDALNMSSLIAQQQGLTRGII